MVIRAHTFLAHLVCRVADDVGLLKSKYGVWEGDFQVTCFRRNSIVFTVVRCGTSGTDHVMGAKIHPIFTTPSYCRLQPRWWACESHQIVHFPMLELVQALALQPAIQ